MFPIALQQAGETNHLKRPWLWLWELELEKRTVTLPPVVFRMTTATSEVSWPPRTVFTASMTVTVVSVTRGRFTAAAGTFSGMTSGMLVDIAGSATTNNRTQAVVYRQDPAGAWLEVVGAFTAEGPRSFSITAGPTPTTFYPFPFQMGEQKQDQDGNLPSLELTIDNTTRLLMSALHKASGFEGNRATAILTHESCIATPGYPFHQSIEQSFTIVNAIASSGSIVLKLEPPQFFQQALPRDRFIAARCRWLHGGPECGYAITPFAGFTTCNHTVSDCTAHGDDEVSRFLPRLHPKRFGGFPGIPQQRR